MAAGDGGRRGAVLGLLFPLEQMNGWNVSAVERFTVARPLTKARDAENYVAALGQVSARMEEAIAESKRLAAKIVPPRFILEATIKQIQNFVDPSPGENPFVTAFADKMATIKDRLRRGSASSLGAS